MMLNKDAVVGMLKNYLLPGAYPVAKADIETTIDFIESQKRDAEMGRAAEKCFEDDIDYMCGRIYNSSNCKFLRGKKDDNCKWKNFCRLRAGKGGE